MKKPLATLALASVLSVIAAGSNADINPGLGGEGHSHVDTSIGKLTSIMIQEQGIEFGTKEDRLDAEVMVTLDNKPGYIFGVRLHEGSQPATSAMVDLLQKAYFNNQVVSLFHVQAPGKKNVNVLRVELKRQ